MGARYAYAHEPRHDGRVIQGTIEVTAMDPLHRMVFRAEDRTRVSEIVYALSDRDGATLFRQTSTPRLKGFLRVAGPVVRPVAIRRIEQQARRLKRRLEAQGTRA